MILRKAKTRNPYVMVGKEFILDTNLSFKAKGILLYMLSRPDNWNFYETEITEHTTDGKSAVRAGIKELIEQKYIVRQQLRENGKFRGYEYIVYETSPLCENRKTVNRKTENDTLLINDSTKKDLSNKIYNNLSGNVALFLETFKNYFGYEHRKILKQPSEEYLEYIEIDELEDIFICYFEKYATGNETTDKEKCSIENVFASMARIACGLDW